jgi:hypothetical protein
MGQHKKALRVANLALVEVIHELNKFTSKSRKTKKTGKFLENAKLLSISHYNCGVE